MAVDIVSAVMTALGLEGNTFQRPTIELYVAEVNEYLKDAGVPEDIIGTETTVGIVARGVADLWSYGAGNGKLSIYFKERAIQLASASSGGGGGGSSDLPPVTPADDGKVLAVVDGKWSPYTLPASDDKKYLIRIHINERDITRIERVPGEDGRDITLDELFALGWFNIWQILIVENGTSKIYGTPMYKIISADSVEFSLINTTTADGGRKLQYASVTLYKPNNIIVDSWKVEFDS